MSFRRWMYWHGLYDAATADRYYNEEMQEKGGEVRTCQNPKCRGCGSKCKCDDTPCQKPVTLTEAHQFTQTVRCPDCGETMPRVDAAWHICKRDS